MTERSHAGIGDPELFQVGIIVRDLEKSMAHYQKTLGIGPWGIVDGDESTISDTTYHGRPVRHRFRAALTTVGPLQLELIQPLEGDSIYSDFLEEHGEGLHHLGYVTVDDLAEAIRTLEKEGFTYLQGGRFGAIGYAYMDMGKTLGTILEFIEVPEGVSLPGRR